MSTQIKDGAGNVVAAFTDHERAVLCLPAMARILRIALHIEGSKTRPVLRIPLPRGCSIEPREYGGTPPCILARP